MLIEQDTPAVEAPTATTGRGLGEKRRGRPHTAAGARSARRHLVACDTSERCVGLIPRVPQDWLRRSCDGQPVRCGDHQHHRRHGCAHRRGAGRVRHRLRAARWRRLAVGAAVPGAWRVWSAIVCAGGRRRRRLLALACPVLLPLTVAVWVAELVVGFALIYVPFDKDLASTGRELTANWVAALYVSAYFATTLGVGDVYFSTGPL